MCEAFSHDNKQCKSFLSVVNGKFWRDFYRNSSMRKCLAQLAFCQAHLFLFSQQQRWSNNNQCSLLFTLFCSRTNNVWLNWKNILFYFLFLFNTVLIFFRTEFHAVLGCKYLKSLQPTNSECSWWTSPATCSYIQPWL